MFTKFPNSPYARMTDNDLRTCLQYPDVPTGVLGRAGEVFLEVALLCLFVLVEVVMTVGFRYPAELDRASLYNLSYWH